MIKGFEDITYDLTEFEHRVATLMISGLRNKIGKEKAIKNEQIKAGLEAAYPNVTFGSARIRKITTIFV